MSCISPNREEKTDPLVDVDQKLKDYAWRVGVRKSFWDIHCKDKLYDLKVNWAYLDVTHRLVRFTLRQPVGNVQSESSKSSTGKQSSSKSRLSEKIHCRDLCLFLTRFSNSTSEPQSFTFKTERQTKSVTKIEVQKGWRIGADLKLSFSVPSGPAPQTLDGLDPINITGGLSGQYEVRKSEGEQFEETLTWSVNSDVRVEPNSVATASLMVREEECTADFEIESRIRAIDAIPVRRTAKKDGRLIDILEIEPHKLADIFKDTGRFYKGGSEEEIRCKSLGTYKAVYGAEQIIDVQSYKL